ncbi:thermostable hemolysin [Shewanella yunxiaonensis]|uniref:Thermostable hemolysin n=1 Tax=Shewanella yunxiaonensis TaxID=2829809 RepID=A0ABX7YQJ5_9GAMM|nr:thermostable hemolysin [Shewanella yunxiaonensis]QUN05040.1 thermostable hemolysin [Shewanella yunxiaonensis]
MSQHLPQAPLADNSSADHSLATIVPTLKLITIANTQRQSVEQFIAAKFQQVHHAQLNSFLPWLIAIIHHGNIVGAYGLRPGQHQPLFLEQYLPSAIEQLVAENARRPVVRDSLIEIGNLALAEHAFGPMLMVTLASVLSAAGYEWMVFTATEQVQRLMQRLGFEPYCLCPADPQRLAGDSAIWGSYYRNNPRVMIGNLHRACDVMYHDRRLSKIAATYERQTSAIAAAIRRK